MDHVEIESTLSDSSRYRRLCQTLLETWSLFEYKAHIGASQYLETWLRQRLFRRGLPVNLLRLSYANDFYGQSPPTEELDAAKVKFARRKIVLYFGSFYRNYGCWDILEVAKRICHLRPESLFVLAGRGPELEACRAYVRENGFEKAVLFPGYLTGSEALVYLHIAHVCVVPLFDTETDWARSPGKLYISMSSNRPIVTPPIGESRDCFLEQTYFYEPGRLESFCGAVVKGLDTPLNWVPNYRSELHSWRARAEVWVSWVESLVKARTLQ